MNAILLTSLLVVGASPLAGPDAELRAALVDLSTRVPHHLQSETRYLSFYNLEPARRREAAAVASFVLNSVSRTDVIVRPAAVPESDDRLWRVTLADYGLPREAWERLASEDPYWHLRTDVLADPRATGSASVLAASSRSTGKASGTQTTTQTVFTDGGWLDLAAAAELRALAQSGGALLRGDHFITRASTTLDGGAYYELADVADDEAAFFESIGIDRPTIDRLRADEGANAIRSGVTFKPRRIVRRQGPLGGAWHTYDTNAATPERDPIRNPFDFTFDAGEHIVAKRNGLHLYALFDRAGRRQDTVPDVIAKDHADATGSGIVVPMISCVRCHVEDGLRSVANDQRRLRDAGVELFAETPNDAQRLAAFYFTDLEKQLRRDREDFADAVRAASGMSGAALSSALARVVRDFADEPVSASRAAAELGVSRERFVEALQTTHDPITAALVVGVDVGRRQWESSFADAAVLVRGAELQRQGDE